MKPLVVGDYVLATKYRDGDPYDHWCIGWVSGFREIVGFNNIVIEARIMVEDHNGNPFRYGGFRRAKRMSAQRGAWLIKHQKEFYTRGRSLWWWFRAPMD